MTREESRALGFVGILLLLAIAARVASRPHPMTITAGPVDLGALRAATEALQQAPKNPHLRNGKRPRTTSTNEPPATTPQPPPSRPARVLYEDRRTAESERSNGPLDLNRATVAELEKLPGVGPAMAKRIVARRDSIGRFTKLEELDPIRGIGPALIKKLEPLVIVR